MVSIEETWASIRDGIAHLLNRLEEPMNHGDYMSIYK